MIHKPVLLGEAIESLNLKKGSVVIDGTLGAGGHAIEILKKILSPHQSSKKINDKGNVICFDNKNWCGDEPGGKLISIDWDKRAIEHFPEKLEKEGFEIRPAPVKSNSHNIISSNIFRPLWQGNQIVGHWCGVNDNYSNLDKIIRGLGIHSVGAVFVDLGFSSDQIEDAKRGFSFLKNGPLDMRYSPEMQEKTAADVVNRYSEKDLADIFWRYGEEKYARRIAKGIVQARKIGKIGKTGELVRVILKSVPQAIRPRGQKGNACRPAGRRTDHNRIHPATRVFQALRIEVNQELENLKRFLEQAVELLASGGKLAVISFHSLEDRIVKNFFREESRDCLCPPNFPKCVCGHKRRLKIITKKPIAPAEEEIRDNPRSRSARLRVAEKI